jgi:putative holliday junction resolvase
MTPGGGERVTLGVDPGGRRVGIAAADHETRFARPVEVIDTATTDPVSRIAELAGELGADEVVVGRPVGLSGRAGPAVRAQQEFVGRLAAALSIPVREFDERLTTVVAERGLRAGGGRRPARALRDAIAAQVMLQGYMDAGKGAP